MGDAQVVTAVEPSERLDASASGAASRPGKLASAPALPPSELGAVPPSSDAGESDEELPLEEHPLITLTITRITKRIGHGD
jgi:hypothetical protein